MAFDPSTARLSGGFDPSSAKLAAGPRGPTAPVETYDPTEGMSGGEKFLAGIGKSFVDVGRGVGQLFGAVSPEQIDEARRLDAPLMRTGFGRGGAIAGAVASTTPLLAIPGGQTITGSALIGAGLGAIQPVGTQDSRIENAVIGGLAAGGTTAGLKTIGRIVKPVQTTPAPADARASRTLTQAGVPLDAAQRSGSPGLARLKAGIGDNPLLLDKVAARQAEQQTGFQRAALKAIGENADAATPDVMGRAYTRIGQSIDDVLGRHSVKPTPQEIAKTHAVRADAARALGADNQIARTLDDLQQHMKANGGKLDGQFYQKIRRELGAAERKADVSPHAVELRKVLDDAFTRTAGPQDAAKLREGYRQWRNMRIIENAIDNEGAGTISPAKLANQFGQKRNRYASTYGKGDKSITELARLAQSGKRLLTEKTPNSGTATRRLMSQSITATLADAAGRAPLYSAIYGRSSNYLVNGIPVVNALAGPIKSATPYLNKMVPAYLLAESAR